MKKGFAISSMLYAMLILFLVILAAILSVIGSQTLILNKLKKNIFNDLNGSNTRQVYQDKSGASYPNLAGDLIPVYYNDETSTWNKANVYEEWYDYDKKNWANAVLLDDDIIPDISGNGNHGYLQGATRNDASVTTDGVDDYVYAGLPNHEFKNEFSIVLRTKLLIENEKIGHLFSCAEGAGIYLLVHPNNKISFEAFSTTKGNYVAVYSTGTYSANKFYTIVGVFKDNKLHLYINGKEAAPPVDFNGETKASAVALLIGANPGGSGCNTTNHTCTNVEQSALDFTDALIFDRALTENEIKYDYASKITNLSNTSKMVLRYDLDDEIKPDTPLPEEVIESYFVWIPKYRYKLWDLGNYASITGTAVNNNPNSIGITFNTENTKDISGRECIATNKSGDVGSCNVNEWMTHPAFTNFGVDGFWVGKFEISKSGNNIAVKPNSETLISTTLKNYFDYI